jgi:hypothetical protein
MALTLGDATFKDKITNSKYMTLALGGTEFKVEHQTKENNLRPNCLTCAK